jgi:HEAT repeat protein
MLANTAASLLRLAPEERLPVALLFAQAFCLGLARLMVLTAGGTLLLIALGAEGLPFVYLASGLAVPAFGLLHGWLERRLAMRSLVLANIGVLLVGSLVLFAALTLWQSPWPSFGLAVWNEVVWALTGLALWPLAGRLFNVRQGKRVFGLINAGDVVAAMFGGLAIPFVVQAFGTSSLVVIAALSLAGALGLALIITRRFSQQFADASPQTEAQSWDAARPGARRYIAFIVTLAALSYAAFYFIDIIFYTQVDQAFTDESQLASFLGLFWAVVYALTLVSNLFAVGPIISRFGVRTGLMLLPALTFGVTVLLVITGAVQGALPFIFGLAVVNNLLDWVFRETIYKSGLLVLYQPLSPNVRTWVQTLVDTIGQPLAQGAVGLTLVGLSLLAFGVMEYSLILVGMLAVVLVLAWAVSGRYILVLTQALAQRRFGQSAFTPPERISLGILRQSLESPYPGVLLYALDTLETMNHPMLSDGLRRALLHPAVEVRREAAQRIARLRVTALLNDVLGRLADEPDASVRGALLRTLAAFGEVPALMLYLDDASEPVRVGALVGLMKHGQLDQVLAAGAQLQHMTISAERSDRLTAAHLIGEVRAPSLQQPLRGLMVDEDLDVRRAALIAAGEMNSPALWPLVMDALMQPATRAAAARALTLGGDDALPSIAKTLAAESLPREIAIRLIRVSGRNPTSAATELLKTQAASPEGSRRHQALLALNQRHYRAAETERAAFETHLLSEAAETARLLAALEDVTPQLNAVPAGNPYRLDVALQDSVGRRRERVLLWLALLCDADAVERVRDSMLLDSPEQRAYALEVLETLVAPKLKPVVFALMEDLAPAQRLQRLSAHFPQMRVSGENRLHEIVTSQSPLYSPWVRTCALYGLTQQGQIEAEPLRRILHGAFERSLLHEMALWALAQIDPITYRKQFHAQHGGHMLSIIEKVIILKSVSIFAETPPAVLAEVANLLEEVTLRPQQRLLTKGEPGRSLYLIVNGRVRVHDGEQTVNVLGPRTIVGEMAVLDLEPRLASVTALEDTLLLRLDQDALYDLMSDRVEVTRGIIRVLSGRLRSTVEELTQAKKVLAEG